MSLATFDILLFIGVLLLAARCLTVKDAPLAAILFIVFGLLLSLAWVRLAAADVALAEAAIGAGVTGALLLDAASQLRSAQSAVVRNRLLVGAGILLCLVFGMALSAVVFTLPAADATATQEVALQLERSGVMHPVTAVLLAFRAYDTLIETAVLLAAATAALALPLAGGDRQLPADPVLSQVVGATVPVALIVAIFLLWAGASTTGGAFQAGSVLAGALLLARFSGARLDPLASPAQRPLLCIGLLVFIAAALAAVLAGGAALGWPEESAGTWILCIEAALMVSIAAALVAFFVPTVVGK